MADQRIPIQTVGIIREVYAVFDSAVSAYGPPMIFQTRGEALRSFAEICADPQSMISRAPLDFSLWLIGRYDLSSALLEPSDHPERVISASAMIESFEIERIPANGASPFSDETRLRSDPESEHQPELVQPKPRSEDDI